MNERLDVVDTFLRDESLREKIREHLQLIGDLERLVSKVAVGRINPREVQQIKFALLALIPIRKPAGNQIIRHSSGFRNNSTPAIPSGNGYKGEITADPPVLLNRGKVIAPGVSAELDELRELAYSGKDYLARMQKKLSDQTGITSLKISFNNVFGYYIEVRNTHKEKVPPEWIRKQTLVGAERYITEELKEYEAKILGAEEKILELETRLFNELVTALADDISPIQLNASILGRIDCLLSFASCAQEYNYVRPGINDSMVLDIKEGVTRSSNGSCR